MGIFLNLDEISKLVEDHNLKNEIIGTKSYTKVKEIINNILPKGMKVSCKTVNDYMEALNQTTLIKITTNIDAAPKKTLAEENKNLSEILDNNIDNKEDSTVTSKKDKTISQRDKNPLVEEADNSSEIFDMNIANNEYPDDASKQDEKIMAQSKGQKNVIYLSENTVKEIDALKEDNNSLVKDKNSLINQNDELKQKLISLKELNEKKEIKVNPMFQIANLNELLNTTEQINIRINKELLVKVTKYVDDQKLIRLENILKNNSDLNSVIVQIILLEFMNQNSDRKSVV